MKKISCHLEGFEPYGYFIGCLLVKSGKTKLLKYKKSNEFYNLVADQLQQFLDKCDYEKEKVEEWFNR